MNGLAVVILQRDEWTVLKEGLNLMANKLVSEMFTVILKQI